MPFKDMETSYLYYFIMIIFLILSGCLGYLIFRKSGTLIVIRQYQDLKKVFMSWWLGLLITIICTTIGSAVISWLMMEKESEVSKPIIWTITMIFISSMLGGTLYWVAASALPVPARLKNLAPGVRIKK